MSERCAAIIKKPFCNGTIIKVGKSTPESLEPGTAMSVGQCLSYRGFLCSQKYTFPLRIYSVIYNNVCLYSAKHVLPVEKIKNNLKAKLIK